MTNSSLVRWLCHIYSVLLFAYPRQFRLQYGGEMRQVFRDRCSYLARTGGRLRLLRFGVHSGADWMATTVRESIDALRTAAPAGETVAGSYWRNMVHTVGRHARSIWSAGRKPSPRGFVAEWAMTILLYLFATTTLVQAYVVPTGSMEGNLRIGDHMLVDRLVYADPGAVGRRLLPYHDVQRGDIVAFLYPEDIRQTYVKRVIGLPGDCIRLVDRQVVRNGRPSPGEGAGRNPAAPPRRPRGRGREASAPSLWWPPELERATSACTFRAWVRSRRFIP